MKRRAFIAALGGAAAWPLVGRGQQPALPMIGYLSSRSLGNSAHIVAAFHRGLNETGFVEGQNVTIESRFAEGNFDRLPTLASDLVERHVNVFVATGGTVSAVKAKPVVPPTVPMVFAMGGDPVKLGVVASLNRPGGTATGVSFLVNRLATKEVELLHELVPKASTIGFLVNPKDPNAESDTKKCRKPPRHLVRNLLSEGPALKAKSMRPLRPSHVNKSQRCSWTQNHFSRTSV